MAGAWAAGRLSRQKGERALGASYGGDVFRTHASSWGDGWPHRPRWVPGEPIQ